MPIAPGQVKTVITALATAAACAALGACAGVSEIPESTALADGAFTAAPAGWVSYCQRHHQEDIACR